MAVIGTGGDLGVKYYDASSRNKVEDQRLQTQASTVQIFDQNVMKEFIDSLVKSGEKKGDTVYILELGGAGMKGARESRYTDEFFEKMEELGYKVQIINAEHNDEAIKNSQEMFGDMFINVHAELNDDPVGVLSEIVERYNDGNKFDMVFSNYVLQHLVNPQETMVAVKNVLSDRGLSMHRVPDDKLKVDGFYSDGKPNDRANEAARGIVSTFLRTLTRIRTDRFLGGKMFDVCTAGYSGQEGVNFSEVCDRLARDLVFEVDEKVKQEYLKRDFAWYRFAVLEAGEESDDPEFKAICFAAAKKMAEYYSVLEEEFLKPETAYIYCEHEIIVTNGAKLEHDEDVVDLDWRRRIEVVNRQSVNANKSESES